MSAVSGNLLGRRYFTWSLARLNTPMTTLRLVSVVKHLSQSLRKCGVKTNKSTATGNNHNRCSVTHLRFIHTFVQHCSTVTVYSVYHIISTHHTISAVYQYCANCAFSAHYTLTRCEAVGVTRFQGEYILSSDGMLVQVCVLRLPGLRGDRAFTLSLTEWRNDSHPQPWSRSSTFLIYQDLSGRGVLFTDCLSHC